MCADKIKQETIFALSSAAGQAGVAVIRVSGDEVRNVYKILTKKENIKNRYVQCNYIYDEQGYPIDQAVTLFFAHPHSFTGEDVLEIQCHGSRAVINAILTRLGQINGCRMAERGEFTRRAVYNNKMDLTSAEGLIDLIHADTEAQRKWAVRQMGGELQKIYDQWREELVHTMAYLEAFIDFPEEEIPPEKMAQIDGRTRSLIDKINQHLDDKGRGQSLKNGFQIAIIGAPNVGKSSLINLLAARDVAIVSETAGTTRDIVEVYLDVAGYPVVISDTAGLRETSESIEKEGIRRAIARAEQADLVIVMSLAGHALDEVTAKTAAAAENVLYVSNKIDKYPCQVKDAFAISAKTQQGIAELWQAIEDKVVDKMSANDSPMLTRMRYKTALSEAAEALKRSLSVPELELKAEELRLAARSLGKITGVVRTEELLDVIFSSFCIGK